MSVRLYIGNLPKEEVDRQELQAVLQKWGMLLPPKSLKTGKPANAVVLVL